MTAWCFKHRVSIAVLAASLCLATQVQAQQRQTEQQLRAQGGRPVTAAEWRTLLVGNTLYGMHIGVGVMATFYRDERNRSAMFQGAKRTKHWWLEGDKLCHELILRDGHTCYRGFWIGATIHGCADEHKDCQYIFRHVPGNPENL